jgi:hypothetical protein
MLYTAELLIPYVQFDKISQLRMDKATERVAKEWLLGIPTTFSWKRKILNFLQSQYHFFGSCIFWTGAWDLFDLFLWEASPQRDIIYGCATLIFMLLFEQIFSRESLIWLFSKKTNLKASSELEAVVVNSDEDHSSN